MAGMFDMFNTDDPQRASEMALIAGLLGGKGSFNSILGRSMMGAQEAGQAAKQRQQAAKLNQLQLEDIQRRAARQAREDEMAALPRQFMRPPSMPGIDATGGMDTALENPNNAASAGGFDMQGYLGALMGKDPIQALQLQAMTKKQKPAPLLVGENQRVLNPETFQVMVDAAPDKPKESDPNKPFMMIDGKIVPNPAYQQYAKDVARSGASSNVNYGSPVAGLDANGNPVFFQAGNKGGPPSVVQGVRPLADKKQDLTESQAKATTYLGQMRSATKSLAAIGADQTALSVQAETALAGGPMNAIIGQKAQRVRQSQEQWSEAFLRFKTGAATTRDEVAANRKTFFPVLGDKPEAIQQKKVMRQAAETDMEMAAGRGTGALNARDGLKPGQVLRFDADGNPLP